MNLTSQTPTPGQLINTASAEPTLTPLPTPLETTIDRITNKCDLLNSHDLAGLFPSAEVTRPVHQLSQVNHLSFSQEKISSREASCVYYDFHRPGSKDMEMLQVTYWVDVPDQAAPEAWNQVWADARREADQVVPNIGDDAFYKQGRLAIKKGGIYLTIEVIGTKLNTDSREGTNQQIEIEKQLALDALSRLD